MVSLKFSTKGVTNSSSKLESLHKLLVAFGFHHIELTYSDDSESHSHTRGSGLECFVGSPENPKSARDNFEKFQIIDALDKHDGNRSKAIIEVGIPQRTFYRRLQKYDLMNYRKG